jgi:ABC-type sulfate transport system substrate-binding protein
MVIDGSQQAVDVVDVVDVDVVDVDVVDVDVVDVDVQMVGHQWMLMGPNRLSMLSMLSMLLMGPNRLLMLSMLSMLSMLLMSKWLVINGY